eukprot:CAMPEP_0119385402 /NCGR_PEP_ID=MMETSP1334-20130426/91068_1 /TAXON_ID=127549 /ORGANISM="Calcidiscus leptoporus, Strain RCC1130" /LENGTH=137 /DNA_ID=CAMNT_0007406687 /DNA_START=203 /DNA_END=617 /DNA_ORIENTATION=+
MDQRLHTHASTALEPKAVQPKSAAASQGRGDQLAQVAQHVLSERVCALHGGPSGSPMQLVVGEKQTDAARDLLLVRDEVGGRRCAARERVRGVCEVAHARTVKHRAARSRCLEHVVAAERDERGADESDPGERVERL